MHIIIVKIYIILFFINWTYGRVVIKAPCPAVKAVNNFNMTAVCTLFIFLYN